ncbi:MAG: regulatory protein RecX, partial [Dehalococcoidia bacterium]
MIVTAVERQRRRRRVHVFVDGRFALALGRELAAEHDVRPGRTLTSAELSALAEAEARRGAMESALRLLSYRPRSEQELRDRLTRKGFEPAVADRTLGRLRDLGYLDDDAFARLWTETQQAFRPRSRWLMTAELRRRGVSQDTAEEATAGLSDEEAAYQAAQRRLRALHGLEFQRYREKLGGYLNRRGFSYEIARRTVDRCWAEREEAPAKEADL